MVSLLCDYKSSIVHELFALFLARPNPAFFVPFLTPPNPAFFVPTLLLMNRYGFFFFAEPATERLIKRFMRDRLCDILSFSHSPFPISLIIPHLSSMYSRVKYVYWVTHKVVFISTLLLPPPFFLTSSVPSVPFYTNIIFNPIHDYIFLFDWIYTYCILRTELKIELTCTF